MDLHAVITVSVSRQDGTPEALAFRAVSPERWTDGEPHALLHAIYDALKPQALIRLHVAPCDDPDCYQLEIACDTGTASTPPLRLSSEALCWLQAREFEMPDVPSNRV